MISIKRYSIWLIGIPFILGFSLLPGASAIQAQVKEKPGASSSGQPHSRGGYRDIDKEVQRRVVAIMLEQLSLTQDQAKRLEEVTTRLEGKRREVRAEEFGLRMALRNQLTSQGQTSDKAVADILDRMPAVARRRIDLMEEEQKELSRFLTAVQRAKYVSLQEQVRHHMEDIRNKRPERKD